MEERQWWVVCLGSEPQAFPLAGFYQYSKITAYRSLPKSPARLRGLTFLAGGQPVWLLNGPGASTVPLPFGVWLQRTPILVVGWILPEPYQVRYQSLITLQEAHINVVSHLCI